MTKSKISVGTSEVGEDDPIWKRISESIRDALSGKSAIDPELLDKSVLPGDNNGTSHHKRAKRVRAEFTSDVSGISSSMMGDTFDRPMGRLSDADQLELVKVDPIIGAIVNTRVNQASPLGDRSESMFDKGVRILDTKMPKEVDYEDRALYLQECKRREIIRDRMMSWVLTCGEDDTETLDKIYIDSDKTMKMCTLKQYMQSQSRALLSCGRCATQMIRDTEGKMLIFRPAPVESIKPVRPGHNVYLSQMRGMSNEVSNEESIEAVESYNKINAAEKPIAWVQELGGRQVAFFTERDMFISYYQMQAQLDLCGYPLSPIEFALYLVYIHQHSLNYLRNQFTKGLLTRSMVCITTKDPEVELGEEDLSRFKRELQNLASRTSNSSVIPVISGPIDVNIKPFDLGPKDLEWQALEQTAIRMICSAFQIAPNEVGFGLLGDPAGLSGDASKDNELVQGEERGLRNLVDIIIESLNHCLYDRFPEAKEEGFKLVAVGLGSETRMAMLQRLQAEQGLTATMNDLLSQSEKNVTVDYGGNVPLNPLFHSGVVKYMHYGVFMEHFFGEKGASQRPDYDFLIDPNLNQMYQSLKTGGREAMIAQNQMAIAQVQAAQQQAAQPQQQEQQGSTKPQQEQQEQPQPAKKSLEQHYAEHEKLNKSLLDEWMNLHAD
jgi:hypothetical protein